MSAGWLAAPKPRSWLAERARRTPEATALALGVERVDYAGLFARAEALARGLERAGVGPGAIVAALFDNGIELPVLFWALHQLDAALLPLNTRLSSEELGHVLRDSGAGLLMHGGGDRAEQAAAARAAADDLPTAHVTRDCAIAEPGAALRVRAGARRLDAPAMAVLYTSGTTGRPKGAVLGAEAFLASARGSAELLGADPGDRWLVCMPLFHVGGLSILVRSCLAGSAAVVHPRFDPQAVSDAIDRDDVTLVSWVANMLARVLEVRGDRPPPPALRCVLLGGGPTPVPLLERAHRAGWPIAPTYGLTEAASQVATRLPADGAPPLDGRLAPLPGTTVRVLDASGKTVPPETPGEIAVAGGTLMRGYLGRAEATAGALEGGWLRTGDVGVLDGSGLLRVLDRRDDLIVSGGENVYPAEVEAVLMRHPDVSDAAVVATPDPRFGARPLAFVVVGGAGATDDALAAHCRGALAAFKVPVAFRRVDALPRSASGKLLRASLRET